jgi:hypothetical protein
MNIYKKLKTTKINYLLEIPPWEKSSIQHYKEHVWQNLIKTKEFLTPAYNTVVILKKSYFKPVNIPRELL